MKRQGGSLLRAPERKDTWASGVAYESYVGRWSRLVAREFVRWLAVPLQARWLDIGCGTGALSQTVLELAAPQSVLGVDPSEGYLELAHQQVQDARANFLLGEAQALPVSSSAYDAVVSGLVLNFMPQPVQALSEMVRAVRRGGTVAAYVWDYAGQMQLMRSFWDAAVALDPAARAPGKTSRVFSMTHPRLQHEARLLIHLDLQYGRTTWYLSPLWNSVVRRTAWAAMPAWRARSSSKRRSADVKASPLVRGASSSWPMVSAW